MNGCTPAELEEEEEEEETEVEALEEGPVRRIPAPAATTITTAITTTRTGVCFVVFLGPFAEVKLCVVASLARQEAAGKSWVGEFSPPARTL
jgi:hypothetical protein